ncbi:hypothetical protein [Variovorax sp. LT1R16]|uniref:hypothetical protein n=1 Tax=Variovorax sp. LT1R16 TaxID=3443728 RepID=UPI003F4584CB
MVATKRKHVDNYLALITPDPYDPTYSILKAHLIFEELLRSHLKISMPNAAALVGARLSFSQRLAVVRAITPPTQVHAWIWMGIEKLNALRNQLAHGSGDKNVDLEVTKYVQYIVKSSGTPLPQPAGQSIEVVDSEARRAPGYLAVDMVTILMYYRFAEQLGFKTD